MDFRTPALSFGLLVMLPVLAVGQLINPDISAVADMRYLYRDDLTATLAGQSHASFEFEEIELALIGYLNPYMRGDFFIGLHGVAGEVELEEGYASVVRGLPAQLRFGKYLLDFGKLNTQHPHQWGWLERPMMHRAAFGPDGASVVAVGASRLQAIGDDALTLSVSAFRSDFFEVSAHEDSAEVEEEHHHGGEGAADVGGSGRLSYFRSMTDDLHLEIGASALAARYSHEHGLDAWLACGDFKLRWRPDTYRGFNLIAETLYSNREVEDHELETVEKVTAWGAFSAAEYRFAKRFDAGVYFDWTEDPFVQDAESTAYGTYFGFMPVEETARFSLVYRREMSDAFDGSSDALTFQVLWSLGPHKPHAF